MEPIDILAVWLSLAWIALAFGIAWLLNLAAERDSAASEPEHPIVEERARETVGRLPAAE